MLYAQGYNIYVPSLYHSPYLSSLAKCLDGVVHHQRVHLCWCSILPALQHGKIHLLYCTKSLAVVLSLWWRDRNPIDSYWVSMVDVPEYPIARGTRGLWQQQQCDSMHCHEEWWGSIPPSVVIFSWVLDEGGASTTCSSRQHLLSVLEVQCDAVLPHQCHTPQWTSPLQHIV